LCDWGNRVESSSGYSEVRNALTAARAAAPSFANPPGVQRWLNLRDPDDFISLNRGLDPTGGIGVFDPDGHTGTYPATVALAIDPFLSDRYFTANGVQFNSSRSDAWLQRYRGGIAADLAVSVTGTGTVVAVGTVFIGG
jgi:hypothetical protein